MLANWNNSQILRRIWWMKNIYSFTKLHPSKISGYSGNHHSYHDTLIMLNGDDNIAEYVFNKILMR